MLYSHSCKLKFNLQAPVMMCSHGGEVRSNVTPTSPWPSPTSAISFAGTGFMEGVKINYTVCNENRRECESKD